MAFISSLFDLMDDNDPVVKEIKIFNCSGVGNKSFLLQFPLVSRENEVPAVQFAGHDAEMDRYEFLVLPPQDLVSSNDMTYKISTQKVNISQPIAVGVLRDDELHLTPIYQVLQGRPMTSANQEEVENKYDLNWEPIQDLDEFISQSRDDISAPMSSQVYQKLLTGSQETINIEMIENLDDNELHSRPPSEQLIYILLKEKTISFDQQLQKHGLQAHKEELLPLLLEYAYYIQGRWTIKTEKLPETILPINFRLPRNFIIVLFAKKKTLPTTAIIDGKSVGLFEKFLSLFNIKREDMPKILENLGVKQKGRSDIVFKFKENPQFEKLHKEYAEQGQQEIENLKETICIARHDEHLFDPFLI